MKIPKISRRRSRSPK